MLALALAPVVENGLSAGPCLQDVFVGGGSWLAGLSRAGPGRRAGPVGSERRPRDRFG